MNKLNIDFENCYGIVKFKHEFSFTNHHTQLIYAPNGMMKTSFAKTLKGLSGQEKSRAKDLLHLERTPKDEVLADERNLNKEQIFVADPEDTNFDSSSKFMNFLADIGLKAKYETIYNQLRDYIARVITPLREVSLSTDCYEELQKTFSIGPTDNMFAIMERLANDIQLQSYTNFGFRYNFVFDKDDKIKKFLDKHSADLRDYIEKYNNLLSTSSVFRSEGNHTFGTHQASELQKSLDNGDFFGVDHKLQLHDGTEITSVEQLKQIFDQEKNRILSDTQLKKSFDKITKAVDGNIDVRNFKGVIMNNPAIIIELQDYEEFRKKTWKGYLCDDKVKQHLIEYNNFYQSKKDELQLIIQQARTQRPMWEKITKLYNDRFHVPFVVEIENQDDIILKEQAAKLRFKYVDDQSQKIEQKKEAMLEILSKGEQRAFYILQLLFDLESRKRSGVDQLIIFDDIADSFDYQNKYAIIEYIHDLDVSAGNVYMLVLTHNFDFYRTMGSRLGLRHNSWMAVKKVNGSIELKSGQYQKDLFSTFINQPYDNRVFISMIPFVRNLIEYTSGECPDYLLLTSCLHLKDDTGIITENDVIKIVKSFTKGSNYARPASVTKVFDLIMSTANSIIKESSPDEIKIENKIVLSIACRLKAEVYMKKQLLAAGLTNTDLMESGVQTAKWIQKMKENCPDDAKIDVIERVNMMTPEFIHINSFMYEPLIDLSIYHLINLYKDCLDL